MDKNEVINIVRRYKEVLQNQFDVKKVILYGSYAKNEANIDSDIDVAIVVDKINWDFSYYAPLIWKLRLDIDTRIEPIMLEEQNDVSGFLEEIKKTGIEI